MEKENKCEDCQYYIRHYSKGKFGYKKTNCGHCIKKKFKTKKPQENCEFFQIINEEKKEEEKTDSAIGALNYVAKILNDLKEYLE